MTAKSDLTPEQIEEFREAFTIFDRDGRGVISIKEFTKLIHDVGISLSETDIQDAIGDDVRECKTLDFKDFITIMSQNLTAEESGMELRSVFSMFDVDGDGLISTSELAHVMDNLGQPVTSKEAELMIRSADLDGDGYVDINDFLRLMSVAPTADSIT